MLAIPSAYPHDHRTHLACKMPATAHSTERGSQIIAEERGLADVLSQEFEPAPYALSSVLTYRDITTSPDGEHVPPEQRLAEIQQRYGPGTS